MTKRCLACLLLAARLAWAVQPVGQAVSLQTAVGAAAQELVSSGGCGAETVLVAVEAADVGPQQLLYEHSTMEGGAWSAWLCRSSCRGSCAGCSCEQPALPVAGPTTF